VEYSGQTDEERKTLLYDPQTAGGLLISVALADAAKLKDRLQNKNVPVAEIGRVMAKGQKPIVVR